MFTIDQWQETLASFLASIDADEAELIVHGKKIDGTRFANNAISQNQSQDTIGLRLRVIRDGRQGIASGNALAAESLAAMAAKALEAADKDQKSDTLLPMLKEQPSYQSVNAYAEDAANATPQERAERVGAQCAKAKAAGYESSGILTTGSSACAIFNSHGLRADYQRSLANLTISAFADGGNTEAMQDVSAISLAGLDCDSAGDHVVERCGRARGAKAIPAGHYDVVLEEAALSDLMLFFSWLGYNSLAHAEGRSGLAGKVGEALFNEHFNLSSDPYHLMQQGQPFDMEGFPTKALTLVDGGVLRDLPHDRRTAQMMKAENTGHGNPQPDSGGPRPASLVVGTGDSSLEEMIASTERGLLVTSFHYTNAVDPMALTITGMTRGGTWLIENGKVSHPVSNMRYTQSLIEAFKNIDAIGKQANYRSGGLFGGGMVLPPMKIRDFAFSSESGF